jgi:hypothetical protein
MIHMLVGVVLARPGLPGSPLEKFVAFVMVVGIAAAILFWINSGNGGDGA